MAFVIFGMVVEMYFTTTNLRDMNHKLEIQKLLLEILASRLIDEKTSKRQLVIQLFKETDLVECTPVAIKMNTILELKDGIDSFVVHDSMASRERLKALYVFVSQLMIDELSSSNVA